MAERHNKGLLIICVFLTMCLFMIFSSTQGSEKHYQIRPEITLPESKTDTERIIDAYEHLVNNYMKLTEQDFSTLHADIKDITKKIDLVNQKVTILSVQMEMIQKKLDIKSPEPPLPIKSDKSDTDMIKTHN